MLVDTSFHKKGQTSKFTLEITSKGVTRHEAELENVVELSQGTHNWRFEVNCKLNHESYF